MEIDVLVYLDHAQLVDLERASPSQRDRFYEGWHHAGAELALSLHHLQEAVQLSDALSVSKWLDVLRGFDSIRCGFASFASVLDFEAQVQLITLLGYEVDLHRSALETFFPPTTVEEISNHSRLLGPTLRQMRDAYAVEAEALETAKQAVRQNPPANIRKKLDPEFIDKLNLDKLLEEAGVDAPPEAMGLLTEAFEHVREAVRSTGTGKAALEHMSGLTHKPSPQLADQDSSAAVPFLAVGAEVVESVAQRTGESGDTVAAVLPRLNPYAAPGFSLRLAIRRGLQNHSRPERPGNQIDIDHIVFAPYVAVLFADGHTYGCVQQERASRSNRMPANVGQNVVRASDLNAVLDILQGLPPEA